MEAYDFETGRICLHLKHKYTSELLDICFSEERKQHKLNLEEYIGEDGMVIYKGLTMSATPGSWREKETELVPVRYLEAYFQFVEMALDCQAWIRGWSMLCDTPDDFAAGLPGGDRVFSSPELEKQYEVHAQGTAYEELEARYFANELLGGT